MKIFLFMLSCLVISNDIYSQGITKYGQNTSTSSNFVNKNGQIGNVSTLNNYGQELTLATLTTTEVTSITNTNATCGGNITANGGAIISAYGVCWSKSQNPTIEDNKTTDGTGTGIFISAMTLLEGGTTYYVRSYATNSVGTAYGNEIRYTTLPPTVATIITTEASAMTSTTAISGGGIATDGGAVVTARGVCWSKSTNPTIANDKTTDGSGTGTFTSSISGLTPEAIYYVRAYATNSVGTIYGNQISFTASPLAIGDSYQGGIIAYILKSGDPGYIAGQTHGIIAAPSDQSSKALWGCYGPDIPGSDGMALGTGNQNTIDIMAGCATEGIAARLCGNLVLGGYSDWFLPSRDELNKVYLSKAVIGGFANEFYWTSTEVGGEGAWDQYFYNGNQAYNYKEDPNFNFHVRAIRSF